MQRHGAGGSALREGGVRAFQRRQVRSLLTDTTRSLLQPASASTEFSCPAPIDGCFRTDAGRQRSPSAPGRKLKARHCHLTAQIFSQRRQGDAAPTAQAIISLTVERVNVRHVLEGPDLEAAVVAGAVEGLGAVAERQAVHRAAVAGERLRAERQGRTGSGWSARRLGRGRRAPAAAAGDAATRLDVLPGADVPDVDELVVSGGGEERAVGGHGGGEDNVGAGLWGRERALLGARAGATIRRAGRAWE